MYTTFCPFFFGFVNLTNRQRNIAWVINIQLGSLNRKTERAHQTQRALQVPAIIICELFT